MKLSTTSSQCLFWIVVSTINDSCTHAFHIQPTTIILPSVFRSSVSSLFSEPLSQSQEGGRSIGDVVQGLHGSKYQFSDAGINFEGQQFAEMSYSSGDNIQEDNYEKEPIPNWAIKKLQSITTRVPGEDCPVLTIGSDDGTSVSVEIQNDERSWEKYYSFIIGDSPSSYLVQPRVGMLAPRGGSNNFSDSATVTITTTKERPAIGNTWLFLCTEAETWTYKVQ